jgi:hypothetical protein
MDIVIELDSLYMLAVANNEGGPKSRITLKKDLRILSASMLLLLIVCIKDDTWAWFGNTLFWLMSFSLMLYCGFLVFWLIVEVYRWAKNGFAGIHRWWIFSLTIVILLASINGMR